jgi:hypothetical protein
MDVIHVFRKYNQKVDEIANEAITIAKGMLRIYQNNFMKDTMLDIPRPWENKKFTSLVK